MRHNLRSRGPSGRISVALILSYVFDWFIIIAAAGIGAALANITPNKRPFSLINPEISFPFVTQEKISTVNLGLTCLVAPAVIIFIVSILLVPGPTVSKSVPKSLIWRRKIWEWHTGWLGLALSHAAAFLITQGMKNLFGKPRPDLLSRCDPDLSKIAQFRTGGFLADNGEAPTGTPLPVLVNHGICRNTDKHIMDDGFRSYPSGHASFAAAGMIYLSLYLASKLAVSVPYLAPKSYSTDDLHTSAFPSRTERRASERSTIKPHSQHNDNEPTGHDDRIIASRNEAAAPPVYLLAIAIIPWFASIYIASTRYSDFRHHGFDILFGYLIGLVTSIFAFRYYHLPIRQGAGWSWGPRSSDRSFWAGIGVGNYAGSGSPVTEGAVKGSADLENGGMELSERHDTNEATNDVGAAAGRRKDAF
ncbi:Acid phosphatase/Vanadium-dependent haloperoxidase [Glarea lozoyensis ATCC 20868]|uniref:Acid phosphatase/Vanadium-dependent haloperoxidase n=1 Tax=Glarea lozoyensis (strain ATCC 20868 / MF5171) TaxID=1116229 RepID=S3D326_GLAL2|nr:Acid phosphatase/Vanadium-dependent haloperoxidase [Glarea lozoyensis ATCC 20868]EPE31569.1 Acid phosphatase/Vanadium-dependent haloperoxidase [Glarea lozoyensis ATCC 20868]